MPLLGQKPFPQGCPQVPILGCCNVRELPVQGSSKRRSPSKAKTLIRLLLLWLGAV